VEYQFGGEESAAYSFEIFGVESSWRRYDERTGSSWSAGLHLLVGREDPESIDPEELGYAPFERYDSEVLSLTASIPVISHVDLLGEWIAYNKARGYNLGPEHDEEEELSGSGGIAGVNVEDKDFYRIRFDYLRLDNEFFSPFTALSYEPGRHGIRTSCRLGRTGFWPSLQLFYKRLYELEEPAAGIEKDNLYFAGMTFDAEFDSGIGGSLSWLDRKEWRGGDILDYSERRTTYTGTMRYRFGPEVWIEGMYQRIDNESDDGISESGSKTDIISLYMRAAF
jgi:hypothetical protein